MRRHHMQRGQPERFVALAQVDADRGDRLARLLDMHDALGKQKRAPSAARAQSMHRVPGLGLAVDQRLAALSAR